MIGFDLRGLSMLPLLGLAAVALIVGGCGGGSTYSLDRADLAQRFLPTERTVPYPPDSLGSLSITKEEGTYSFELTDDYESLHRKWSCTYQDLGAGRSRRGRSYATLWSLELSLASLEPGIGITTLSEEQARETVQERRKQYGSTIQVDVFWFEVEGESLLTGPGAQVELQVDGETYRPAEEKSGPLRETFLTDRGETTLYRRNSFYFPRIVEGTDILKGAQGVELHVSRTRGGPRVRFAWSWKTASQADARSTEQRFHPLLRVQDRASGATDDALATGWGIVPTVDH